MAARTETAGLDFVQLLADPHRWRVLHELSSSDRRVNELTELLGQPQNLVSYHLRQLREAGLVTARRSSADRRDTYYRVDVDRVSEQFSRAGAALQPGLRLAQTEAGPTTSTRRRKRVLFLCTGNSARSQMAEALMDHRSAGSVDARSAGSHPKALHPNAVRVLATRGIDISDRKAKHLRRFQRMQFDVVVTLCDRVREICPPFARQPRLVHWSIADPALEGDGDEASYPAFARTADELESRLTHLIAQLHSPPDNEETAHA